MEKLVAVQRDPRFDLIILDTPPTANALDFLDAPERADRGARLGDDALVRPGVRVDRASSRLTCSRARRRSSCAASARITGGGFLEAMAEFITELNDLFGGFKQRAQMVRGGAAKPGGVVRARHEPGADEHPGGALLQRAPRAREHAARRVRGEPLPRCRPSGSATAPERERRERRARRPRAACSRTDAPARVLDALTRTRCSSRALDALHVRALGERARTRCPSSACPSSRATCTTCRSSETSPRCSCAAASEQAIASRGLHATRGPTSCASRSPFRRRAL